MTIELLLLLLVLLLLKFSFGFYDDMVFELFSVNDISKKKDLSINSSDFRLLVYTKYRRTSLIESNDIR